MSERPPGVPPGVVPRVRDSSVVIAARKNAAGEWEVLMGRRSSRSNFFPGNWAFPGGALEAVDEPDRPGAHERAGSRELHEETGLVIPPERLVRIGTKITPPFHPIRHRTEFFLAPAPDIATLGKPPMSGENEDLRFIPAREALDAWESGAMMLPPPLPPLLRVFARERQSRFDQLPRLLAVVSDYEERVPRIEFIPGVWMHPVASHTLAPATHTNVWLVGGRKLAIVDPGAAEPYDLENLAQIVDRRRRMGSHPAMVLLTHHHRDHVEAAGRLAERFELAVRAHPATADLLGARGFGHPVVGDLVDGTTIALGGMTLVVRETPGHAAGHVVFEMPERGAALVGDLVSGFSSILIHPDEGDMDAYLDSLRRVRALAVNVVFPAHGPPLGAAALDEALAHRLEREELVRTALSEIPRPLAEIAALAYAGAPGTPPVLAGLQTLAHLQRLARRGEARQVGDVDSLWSAPTGAR